MPGAYVSQMKEFFYYYQRCASYSWTLHNPGLLLLRMQVTDLQFRDSPGHSGTVGHPKTRMLSIAHLLSLGH